MIEAIFIFTAAMVFTAMIKHTGLIFGHSMALPYIIPRTDITPTYWVVWYPSLMFQLWFWANNLGVFS